MNAVLLQSLLKTELKRALRGVKNALTPQDVSFMRDLSGLSVYSFLPKKDDIRRAEKLKQLGFVEMNYSLTSTSARLTAAGETELKKAR